MADERMQDSELTPEFWGGRYQTGETGWDLGTPSPPLMHLHQSGQIEPCRVVVPGCGRGWEVTWLAAQGYTVTGVDFSAEALAIVDLRARAEGLKVTLVQSDVLAPVAALHGQFDLVFEQTCYCAIDPLRRADYVTAMHRLLIPGGTLAGLFYACKGDGGPPFTTTPEAVREQFSAHFEVGQLALTDHSHERRSGEEWLGLFTRR